MKGATFVLAHNGCDFALGFFRCQLLFWNHDFSLDTAALSTKFGYGRPAAAARFLAASF
jgi:hypothetical protein